MSSNSHANVDPSHLLQTLAVDYDDDYRHNAKIIGEVGDAALEIYQDRQHHVKKLHEEVQQWTTATRDARNKASDNAQLEKHRRDFHRMQMEHASLVQDIMNGEEEAAHLSSSIQNIEREIKKMKVAGSQTEQKFSTEYPTAHFIHKLLTKVSETKILSAEDADVIQGLILKGKGRDVVPFSLDTNKPSFDVVNSVWNTILD